MEWLDVYIIGYYGGEKVIEKKYFRNPIPTSLLVSIDDNNINSDEMDVTRVVVKAVDEYDNLLPFIPESINVIIEGAGELIGPSNITLIGGVTAFWVKNKENEQGTIKVTISSNRFKKETVEIQVD